MAKGSGNVQRTGKKKLHDLLETICPKFRSSQHGSLHEISLHTISKLPQMFLNSAANSSHIFLIPPFSHDSRSLLFLQLFSKSTFLRLILVLFSPVIPMSTTNLRAQQPPRKSPLETCTCRQQAERGLEAERSANTYILKLCNNISHLCTIKVQFKKRYKHIFHQFTFDPPTLRRNLWVCSFFTSR